MEDNKVRLKYRSLDRQKVVLISNILATVRVDLDISIIH